VAPPTGGTLRRRRGRVSAFLQAQAQAQAQVEAGGGTLANIVKITTFLTDIRYREELVPIREEFFGRKTPAVSQVAVSALGRPEWLIEVEAIAVL
jgi:enamine deaminase RidA (YjgF/YER057c/UK114 family)